MSLILPNNLCMNFIPNRRSMIIALPTIVGCTYGFILKTLFTKFMENNEREVKSLKNEIQYSMKEIDAIEFRNNALLKELSGQQIETQEFLDQTKQAVFNANSPLLIETKHKVAESLNNVNSSIEETRVEFDGLTQGSDIPGIQTSSVSKSNIVGNTAFFTPLVLGILVSLSMAMKPSYFFNASSMR